MIFSAGEKVTFNGTAAGRERAAQFAAAYPQTTRRDLKELHVVHLLADFELRPIGAPGASAKKFATFRQTFQRIGQLCLFLLVFLVASPNAGAGSLGETLPLAPIWRDGAAVTTIVRDGWRVSGGEWAATMVAEVLPDPKSSASIGWLIVCLGAILVIWNQGKQALSGGQQALKQPVIIKASQDGPDRIEFNMHVQGLDELKKQRTIDVAELKLMIEGVSADLKKFSSDNYKRRRAMHREINAQREALAFLAGQMSARGDSHGAEHVRELIRVREEQEDAD